jgi:hypothetical protein
MGLPKVQMGQEQYLLVRSRCLQACLGQCQPQFPRHHVRFSGCNMANMMMVAFESDGGTLWSPEVSPL